MKRFFKEAAVSKSRSGFTVLLDGKPLKNALTQENLVLSTQELADAVALEWENAGEQFEFGDFPISCFVMGALALDADSKKDMAEKMIAFARTDTLLFVSPYPEKLKNIQEKEWTPVVDFINGQGADFRRTSELSPPDMSEKTQAFLRKTFESMESLPLSAVQKISGGCQSVLLALAVFFGHLTAEKAFALSGLEENFQNESWGRDEEAERVSTLRKNDVLMAEKALLLSREGKK